jgi:DnaJ-class molecular chaperone
MVKKEKKKICEVCGGTGQVSYFKGVSRFLLSNEECEECAGTGYILDTVEEKNEIVAGRKPKKRKQNR